MAGQPLRGLVGQSMSGQKKRIDVPAYSYPPGTYTFTAPASGWWRVVAWGAGGKGGGTGGGGGGAFIQADRVLRAGQTVSITVGPGGFASANTTVTLPGGEVLTAGCGASNAVSAAGGVATTSSPDDIKLSGGAAGAVDGNGSAGQGTNPGGGGTGVGGGGAGGGGAAGQGNYRGGNGSGPFGAGTAGSANSPGGGAGGGAGSCVGGDGQVIIHRIRVKAN